MTAISKIQHSLPSEPFQEAIGEVNEWRGKCLYIFATAELAVTECLETLSQVPGRGSEIKKRHLIGQRYEDLSNALSTGGVFHAEGEKALHALTEFRKLDQTRTMLCHGSSEVLLDAQGQWTAVFQCLSFKAGAIHCEEHVVRRSDAEKRQRDLSREARRLCDLLGKLNNTFRRDPH